jgi:hypothetical protein
LLSLFLPVSFRLFSLSRQLPSPALTRLSVPWKTSGNKSLLILILFWFFPPHPLPFFCLVHLRALFLIDMETFSTKILSSHQINGSKSILFCTLPPSTSTFKLLLHKTSTSPLQKLYHHVAHFLDFRLKKLKRKEI